MLWILRLSPRERPPKAGEEGERSELNLTFTVKCIRCVHSLSATRITVRLEPLFNCGKEPARF